MWYDDKNFSRRFWTVGSVDQRIESALREGWHRDRECSDYSGKLPPPQEGLADFSEGRKGSSGNAAVFVDFYCFPAKFCIFDKGGSMAKLTHDFFNGDTVAIAQALLGKYLVRNRNDELLAGRITETEAYVGRCDKACHAYNYRRTPRTETLFMAPGHAYIYFIYGMYHCLNFVTEPEGEPSAVLLRGLEPTAGAETMKHLRFGDAPMNAYRRKNFLNGPGKVCKALDLTTAQNKLDLEGDVLFLCDSMADVGLTDPVTGPEHICAGPRIGVDYAEEAKDFPWRFWLEKEN